MGTEETTVSNNVQNLSYLPPLMLIVAAGANAYFKNWWVVTVVLSVLFCVVADEVIRKAGK